ncbi:MAG: hypothetical protein MUD08_12125 [Cytophagales bacterium]|jgi:hypothetical protein|nr:hypothetical protein [Cytophagales bacterium]
MKKSSVFRGLSQGLVAAFALTVFASFSSPAQSAASVQPKMFSLMQPAPAALETAVYQVPQTTKFKVHFVNNTGKAVTVKLLDAGRNVLYTESVSAKNYIRKFDLEPLGDGKYQFEITGGGQTVVRQVDLQTVTARTVQVQ